MGLTPQGPEVSILPHFQINGELLSILPFGSGHIHDTYLVTVQADSLIRLILQKVNDQVFTQTVLVCNNIKRVSDHIRKRLEQKSTTDIDRKSMQVIPSEDGKAYFQDESGVFWRLFTFIEGSVAVDEVKDINQAYEAAKAIGEFQLYLSDLDTNLIGESIPKFHHIGWRYENLELAIREDRANRVGEVAKEIAFAREVESIKTEMLSLLDANLLPVRVVHNDTKINNVLFDQDSGKAICVIDLDTVMPGSVLYDFGDMVRTFTSPAPEDETDFSKVFSRMEIYEGLVKGYLEGAASFITPLETKYLILGAKVITLIMGVRFLTDYLNGDVYYKIQYSEQNLNRCRNQFKLLADILEKEEEMEAIIHQYSS